MVISVKGLFRNERITELKNNRAPIKILETAKIVLHLIAEESSTIDKNYNIEIISRNPKYLKPIKYMGMELSHTFDGFLTYTTDLLGGARSYAHLYRRGIIEAVEISLLKPLVDKKEIPSVDFEKEIILAIPGYIEVFKRINVKPPFSMFLSLVGVEGYLMKLNKEILGATPIPIQDNIIKLEEIYIEDYAEMENIPGLLQSWFDDIWSACGMFKSFNYDENGNWGYGLNSSE